VHRLAGRKFRPAKLSRQIAALHADRKMMTTQSHATARSALDKDIRHQLQQWLRRTRETDLFFSL
jgi:hypothetical protein